MLAQLIGNHLVGFASTHASQMQAKNCTGGKSKATLRLDRNQLPSRAQQLASAVRLLDFLFSLQKCGRNIAVSF